ncbi:MFS transporter [Sphingomonas suaedae]|uniref:MFS transporter n=1 Tax=Sphingomonas suaedae TaxID=2599297 RepID=A0A518RK30_9SPHN|nr:MFS transporter [Sphingomonas suaedae]QDX27802.1 MFS transporter [Sphingomonas suaedae]
MTASTGTTHGGRRSIGFILLVALANAGGVIAFLPLLSLLLPVKVAAIAGEDGRIGLFTATVIAGALTASVSNIAFGWASDRARATGKGRRPWALLGLMLLALSFAAVALASTATGIILAIILFQIAVNALLSPLFAIMADEVPGDQMGVAGGLIALGSPLASAVAALMIALGIAGEGPRLAFVFAAVLLCVLPLLRVRSRITASTLPAPARLLGRDLAIAWTARLLVQVAGTVLGLYLLYYFASIEPDAPTSKHIGPIGQLMTVAYLLPLPVAVLLGRWSDRIGRRKPFLVAAATIAALGLIGMGLARDWNAAAIAFALYALGSAVFLSIHSGFAMQLLPSPQHRGRDLGLINLTNTLPALAGPLLTWLLATPRDFGAVMLVLAVLTLLGGLLVLGIRQQG